MLAGLAVVLHVLTVFALVGGIVGRGRCLIYLTIIPVIVFIFVPRGRVYERAMNDAIAENRVTPALMAALRDPWVQAGRVYEILMVVALSYVMIVKPF